MLELRYLNYETTEMLWDTECGEAFETAVFKKKLQFRVFTPCVNASGSLCPGDKWSDWQDIPIHEQQLQPQTEQQENGTNE